MRHSTNRTGLTLAAIVAVIVIPALSQAQTIASRVASFASSGAMQFTYASGSGVCGNGRSWYSIGGSSFYGNYDSDFSRLTSEQCVAGPVRVVLDVSDHIVVGMRTFVGPVQADGSTVSLGGVGVAAATDYLLSLAASSEGRVGSEALNAALLADSVDLTDRLLAIGRDNARPLETRRSALSALASASTTQIPKISEALIGIARNENETQSLRQRALSSLARLGHGDGIPPLIQLAARELPSWVGRESLGVLARSGDPRAREYLRAVIQRTDLPDDALSIAIRGFGREYVTSRDAQALRDLFPRLTGSSSSEAVLSSLGELGGAENVQWLLGLVRNSVLQMETRRRALQYLTRAGVPTQQLVALYDATTDAPLKEALISVYSRLGEKASTDKLVSIAKSDENLQFRRRAISALSRNNDPTVKEALAGIVERM
ncbi:MAG: HEAT repeat domain-containing protein [Gemmatimonadota bacterium]|nr:HEAT repeat domain-containing protein [Gemmatimonadota bacterium]